MVEKTKIINRNKDAKETRIKIKERKKESLPSLSQERSKQFDRKK